MGEWESEVEEGEVGWLLEKQKSRHFPIRRHSSGCRITYCMLVVQYFLFYRKVQRVEQTC